MRLPVLEPSALDDARRGAIAADLCSHIDGDVRFAKHDRMLYATDASFYQVEPIGVVVPRSMADVERTVAYCAENNLPILPRGGGTSLAGQSVNFAVMIDFAPHCDRILDIDAANKLARVEPGVILAHLNQALAPHGLMFGPDVATAGHANIGGMIGNNSSGAHSVLYGRTVEHLIGLDVLLADGSWLTLDQSAAERDERARNLTRQVAEIVLPIAEEIDARFPKILRHVDGYNLDVLLEQLRQSTSGTFDRVNLAHLLCGSEGTLGVTTEATLNLVDAPRAKGLAIVAFTDVDHALRAVEQILETKPAAVELVDDVVLGLAEKNAECRRYLAFMPEGVMDGRSGSVLYIEYFAEDDDQLAACFASLETKFPKHPTRTFTDPAKMTGAWKLRAAGEPLLHGLPGERKPQTFVEDAAVNPRELPAFIRDFRALIARHGTTAAYYAHASVGCLHVRPLINLRDDADRHAMHTMATELCDLVKEYGGALSGEHGDGRLRSHLLERFYGEPICDAFAQIKSLFDPRNLLNPGNIIGTQPMTESLRTRPQRDAPQPRVPDVDTFYRYDREHGFAGAVEMCNGAGVCRKMSGGTMCPSYRATRDERHATRGRGNALRLAITGQFSVDGETPAWNDPETHKTLDLCLSCKACKSECPSNVDMAKLKAEYLAQKYEQAGRVPMITRAFAHVRTLNRIGAAVAPLANALTRFPLLRGAIRRALGIHQQRTLPRFEKNLYRWFAQHNRETARSQSESPSVVLLPDCFTVYNAPAIGRVAILTLEALGYRVILPQLGCCGRSMISLGMLREAIDTCSRTAGDLLTMIDEHDPVAIVGCEPSCISAVTDDWPDLKLNADRERVQAIAGLTMPVEDFIASHRDEHPVPIDPEPQTNGPPVLLHGHCHQKALTGLDTSAGLLTDLLGDRFRIIDSGCCGMAGAFGLTRDHFDLSMEIGELSLFPPIRNEPEAIILATGTSCRHQIHDALGRRSLHPVELLHKILSRQIA